MATDNVTAETEDEHDATIKQLLQAFISEFFAGFFPEVAARLDFATVQWLDKESFPDPPGGETRIADLVAQVQTVTGQPELVLLHIEPQRKREKGFAERMFEYWFLLRRRYRTEVFPVALYLTPGAGGMVSEKYTVALWGKTQLQFEHEAVGVPDLLETDYAHTTNPVLWTFRALMRERKRYSRTKSAPGANIARRLQLLDSPLIANIDAGRQPLLVHFVEKYLPLTAPETVEYERQIAAKEKSIVATITTEYERKGIAAGKVEGKAEGVQAAVLRIVEKRFGAVPADARQRIENIRNIAELEALLDRALSAASPSDLGLAPA